MIGIVVLNYNEYRQTEMFIQSVNRLNMDCFLVIVDNHSTNSSFAHLSKYNSDRCVVIDSGKNAGYSYGNNIGLLWLRENTTVKYAIVANPDTYFDDSYVNRIVEVLENNPQIGLLTGIMVNEDGSLVDGQFWKVPTYLDNLKKCFLLINRNEKRKECEQQKIILRQQGLIYRVPAGSCEIVRMEAMEKSGYFDDDVFLFYEENIMAKRLEKVGYSVAISKDVSYHHLHSTTISKNINVIRKYKIYLESMYIFEKKYNDCRGLKRILLKIAVSYAFFEFCIYTYMKSLVMKDV